MNIYISHENEEFLRNRKGSMSGLINSLIDKYRVSVQDAKRAAADAKPIDEGITPDPTYEPLD